MPQCSKQVRDQGRWPSFHQCMRAGVVTRDGKSFCRQHDPQAVATRDAERSAKWRAKADARTQGFRWIKAGPKLLAACEEAVEDHTMPAEDDMNDSGEPWCTSCDQSVRECGCSMHKCREAIADATPKAPTT